MAKELDDMERRELFDLFIKIQECKNEIESLIRHTRGWQAAKAYWYASLSSAIDDDEYPTNNPTFKSFLISEDVINKKGEFLAEDDENDDDGQVLGSDEE